MRKSRDFSCEELLTTILEAEKLATQVDAMKRGQEPMSLIYRWVEMADQAAMLIVQAEEMLGTEELATLQTQVNKHDAQCWSKYRRNIRWLNKPTGQD